MRIVPLALRVAPDGAELPTVSVVFAPSRASETTPPETMRFWLADRSLPSESTPPLGRDQVWAAVRLITLLIVCVAVPLTVMPPLPRLSAPPRRV